jgi:predicted alpha/beta-fold hydrolase
VAGSSLPRGAEVSLRPARIPGVPEFVPHPLVRGGHAQTLFGFFFPGLSELPGTTVHRVELEDGDAVTLHDNVPAGWREGGPSAVLLHGLTGSARSGYMVRAAAKLSERGIRTFRMDHRTCGAGLGLARFGYHAGRSGDVREVLQAVAGRTGGPVTVIGFSLSGNLVLKMLGENPASVPEQVVRAIAVNPSADLAACSRMLETPLNRVYDRHFMQAIYKHIGRCPELYDRERITSRSRPIRTLAEFDEVYTAPVNGFSSAAHYYAESSSVRFVPRIEVPTVILASADDPVVPVRTMLALERPPNVALHVASSGGHIGFIGRNGCDRDRRWVDWRIVDWTVGSPAALASAA